MIKHSFPSWVYPCLIAFATALVWHGAVYSGFTPDDYGFFDVLSPIRSFLDVIAAFWRYDPNPQYWRPMANATYSWDFLMWGWNGYAFHATNIILHAVAAVLIYYFTKRIFSLNNITAFLLAVFFGVSGSHDSNVLWISARTDVIATIMMMAAMLSASVGAGFSLRGMPEGSTQAKARGYHLLPLALSFIFYFFALASKEISGILIVLLPLMVWSDSIGDLWKKKRKIMLLLLPYLVITAFFLFLRSGFTLPLHEMQPFGAEGSRSLAAFARNFVYSIGYMLAPIDFQTASILIGKYAVYGYTIAAALLIGAIVALRTIGDKQFFRMLYKPFVLTVVSGIVAFQSFERWRIYFPSVGVLAIIAIILSTLWKKGEVKRFRKPIIIAVLCFFFIFHLTQSIHKQLEWAEASNLLRRAEKDILGILSLHKERPITLNFLTCPTKLGGAPIMQLGRNYLLIKIEAERLHLSDYTFGNIASQGEKVHIALGVDVYALDPEKGFRSYSVKQIGEKEFEVRGDENEIGISVIGEFNNGVAKRDRVLNAGDMFETDAGTVSILKARGAMASHVKIKIKDFAGLPVYFDGNAIRTVH